MSGTDTPNLTGFSAPLVRWTDAFKGYWCAFLKRKQDEQNTADTGRAGKATKTRRSNYFGLGLTPGALACVGVPFTDLLKTSASVYLASILVNILGIALPISILQVYDRIIPNQSIETLTVMVVVLVGITVAEALLRIMRLYVVGWSAARFSHNLSNEALGRLLHARPDQIWNESPSKTLDRFEAVSKIGMFFGGTARQVVVDVPFAAIFILIIAVIGGYLVLVPIVIIIIFTFITFLYSKALQRNLSKKDEHDVRSFDFVSEVLRGITTIRGQAMEPFMQRRFERLVRASADLIHKSIGISDQAQTFAGMLGTATMVTMVTIGAIFAVNGDLSVGTLAACSMLSGRAVQPVLRVAGMWNEFQHTKLAVNDAATIFALPHLPREQPMRALSEPPQIEFRDVDYIYPGTDEGWHGITFTIEPGNLVTLCGPGGVGKSTILKMIAGTLVPQNGVVSIGDLRADEFRRSVKNSVGYVSAATAPLQGTIFENLTSFGMGVPQETALFAARQLGIEEEINRFPEGYDTHLGGRAVERISNGLVQRILIARALAQRPSVLILDEAQSFFDPPSHAKLCETLLDLRCTTTIMLVTNLPEYVAISDKVFDISPGKIVERARAATGPGNVTE